MAKRIRYVVSGRGGRWVLSCGRDPLTVHDTQREAIAAGARLARQDLAAGRLAELLIKGRNGRIRDSRTYGRDPRRTPG